VSFRWQKEAARRDLSWNVPRVLNFDFLRGIKTMKVPFNKTALSVIAALLFLSPALAQQVSQAVEFETIAKYFNCGHIEKKNYVITNTEDWEMLWDKVVSTSYPRPQAPDVDFSKHSLIAVFQGNQSSSGYSISVERLVKRGSKLKVHVREVSPADACRVLLVLTQPFEIIKVDKIDDAARVRFKVKREITACRED
jgi:PrcB C-terminal